MNPRLCRSYAFAASILISSRISLAYEDDDLLCRPGWSPELYQQQIWQQNNQQRISMIEYQYATANAAAELRSREMARIARQSRLEKAARKREALIAKRKADSAARAAMAAAPSPSVNPASKPNP